MLIFSVKQDPKTVYIHLTRNNVSGKKNSNKFKRAPQTIIINLVKRFLLVCLFKQHVKNMLQHYKKSYVIITKLHSVNILDFTMIFVINKSNNGLIKTLIPGRFAKESPIIKQAESNCIPIGHIPKKQTPPMNRRMSRRANEI